MIENLMLTDKILFDPKPTAVPYNYRISYKVPQLLLVLSKCSPKRGGCSLIKLQMVSTSLGEDDEIKELINFSKGVDTNLPVVRFDPAVNKAVAYAIAEDLVIQQKNGKYKLSDRGKKYITAIEKDPDLMRREKQYLIKLGSNITEEMIDDLMSKWRYQNASNQSN